MTIKLSSPSFQDGGTIPGKFTCDGENVSPELRWDGFPAKAKSLAITCADPDAASGNWVHWVLYDVPVSSSGLAENVTANKLLDNGAKQGITDFGSIGYGGPCPHAGEHRYIFKIFALDSMLGLPPGSSEKQLLKAMKGRVLDEGKLTGKYSRW